MKNFLKNPIFLHLAGIITVAFIVTIPIWIYGISGAEDALRHFQFANSVYDSLSHGNIYLQTEPNVNHGYGGVALRLYPPFTYYLMAGAHLITQDWYNAAFLFFWSWMSVSGIGLYFLAREYLSEQASLLAAIIYLIEPFHNAQIQLTYAYAEFVAGGLLTFCFLFSTRAVRRGKIFDIAGLALSYGLLLLTHIPIAIIGSFCLLLYCVCSLNQKNWKAGILKLTAGVSLGALAAAFHWVRIFSESQWINHSSAKFLTEGPYDYRKYFVNLGGTFFPGDLVLLNLMILLIPSLFVIFLKLNRDAKKILLPVILTTLFSIFMATSFSEVIWENIATLQKIQFPWRWLTISIIGASILIAAGVESLAAILKERKLILILWIAVCILANGYFTYAYILGSNLLDVEFLLIRKQALEQKVEEKATAPYHVFWQTIWAKNKAFEIKDKVQANERPVEVLKWEAGDKEFNVVPGNAGQARIALFYYPYWQAKVNNINVEISQTDDGAVLIPLPPEESIVEITFVEPFIVKFFITISVIAWITILGLFLMSLRGRLKDPYPENLEEIKPL